MPSVAAQVDIYNMALDLLEEKSLSSVSATGAVADWLNRNYPTTRDAELRSHAWNFALTRVLVAEDAAAPAFEWLHQYQLPSDALSPRMLTENGKLNGRLVKFELEGNKILTDQISPLKLRYIRRVENEGEFDPLFVEALVAKLGYKMAHWMTGKQSFSDRIREDYREAVIRAYEANAIETTQAYVEHEDVIDVRA